jgi:hypothetical protein
MAMKCWLQKFWSVSGTAEKLAASQEGHCSSNVSGFLFQEAIFKNEQTFGVALSLK